MIKMCDKTADCLPDFDEIINKPSDVCAVRQACEIAKAARLESCGKDVMCRDGLAQLAAICESISKGSGSQSDLKLLKDCCEVIELAGGCEMAVKCARLILKSMEVHAEEWEDHVGGRKRCKALACVAFCNIYIDPALCKGSGCCLKVAPEGAVAGGEGMISVVKKDAALKTDEFMSCCPNGAIKKYSGAVKPPCPVDPVPVGSFGVGAAGGGRRRRRG